MFGVLSLAVAGGTAAAAWSLVASYQEQVQGVLAVDAARSVVVAAHRLRPGATITEADLALAPISGLAAADVFTSVADAVGKTVADAILEGEPVRAARLTDGGGTLELAEILDPGHRAVTILASRAAAVGGLLKPGSTVDVILTIRPERGALASDWVADTILQGVRVIGVGSQVAKAPVAAEALDALALGRDVYVTLEVDPDQAERLALASTRGQLVLSMRAAEDKAVVASSGPVATSALLGAVPAPRRSARPTTVAAATDSRTHTEVILGNRVTVEAFDEDGRHVGTGGPAPLRR